MEIILLVDHGPEFTGIERCRALPTSPQFVVHLLFECLGDYYLMLLSLTASHLRGCRCLLLAILWISVTYRVFAPMWINCRASLSSRSWRCVCVVSTTSIRYNVAPQSYAPVRRPCRAIYRRPHPERFIRDDLMVDCQSVHGAIYALYVYHWIFKWDRHGVKNTPQGVYLP